MAKTIRKNQKQFGETGSAVNFGKFGSLAAGAPATTKDIAQIQSLPQFLKGWSEAVLGEGSPALEDLNSLCYLFSYQLKYILQAGISEWDSKTEYFKGSIVNDGSGVLYVSRTNSNKNNALSTASRWALFIQKDPRKLELVNPNFEGVGTLEGIELLKGTTNKAQDGSALTTTYESNTATSISQIQNNEIEGARSLRVNFGAHTDEYISSSRSGFIENLKSWDRLKIDLPEITNVINRNSILKVSFFIRFLNSRYIDAVTNLKDINLMVEISGEGVGTNPLSLGFMNLDGSSPDGLSSLTTTRRITRLQNIRTSYGAFDYLEVVAAFRTKNSSERKYSLRIYGKTRRNSALTANDQIPASVSKGQNFIIDNIKAETLPTRTVGNFDDGVSVTEHATMSSVNLPSSSALTQSYNTPLNPLTIKNTNYFSIAVNNNQRGIRVLKDGRYLISIVRRSINLNVSVAANFLSRINIRGPINGFTIDTRDKYFSPLSFPFVSSLSLRSKNFDGSIVLTLRARDELYFLVSRLTTGLDFFYTTGSNHNISSADFTITKL